MIIKLGTLKLKKRDKVDDVGMAWLLILSIALTFINQLNNSWHKDSVLVSQHACFYFFLSHDYAKNKKTNKKKIKNINNNNNNEIVSHN